MFEPVTLNLPSFQWKMRHAHGKIYIFDSLRKKYVILTPEEWVRQNFIRFLIEHLNFPKGLFRIEKGLRYNRKLKRADILACSVEGRPLLLVECKAPDQPINQEVFNQASVYNKELEAKYVVITNGLKHFCYETDFSTHRINFLEQVPAYEIIAE